MERYFLFDDKNTFLNWHLILTEKDIAPPEIKTNYVDIGGMSGSLDLTEALTGEITYNDRTISASFWTDYGKRDDRSKLLHEIRCYLHGRKLKIVEPDDPEHYFVGRVKITSESNNLAYAEMSLEITCEPWRYSHFEIERRIDVSSYIPSEFIITNHGVKSLCPDIIIDRNVSIYFEDTEIPLSGGRYKISDIKFRSGFNMIRISGHGSATFVYREAIL